MPTIDTRVEQLKTEGNKLCQVADYHGAIDKYSAALAIQAVPALFSNRALAYLKLDRFGDAIADCKEALRLDPTFERAQNRLAYCHILIGNGEEAMHLLKGTSTEAQNYRRQAMQLTQLSNIAVEVRNKIVSTLARALITPLQVFPSAEAVEEFKTLSERLVSTCEAAHHIAPSAVTVSVALAAAYIVKQTVIDAEIATVRGREQEAVGRTHIKRARDLLLEARPIVAQQQESAAMALAEMLCYAQFALGDFADARAGLQRFLQAHPDSAAISGLFRAIRGFEQSKERVGAEFKAGHYDTAAEGYLKMVRDLASATAYPFLAVAARMAASQCFNNRSFCFMKKGDFKAAVEEATVAVALNPAWRKALVRRAMAAEKAADYQVCAHDYATLARLATNAREKMENEQKHRTFEAKAAKAAQVNPYTTLGISESEYKNKAIPEALLKRVYRKACVRWHPDKWSGASEEEKAKADKMIKDVNEAYEILKDPKRKQIYDAGGDLRMGGVPDMGGFGMGGMPGFRYAQGGPGAQFVFSGMPGMGGMPGGMESMMSQVFSSFMSGGGGRGHGNMFSF